MSTGRVMWIIWCCLWAGFWAIAAVAQRPRPGCLQQMLFVVNGQWCAQFGQIGNTGKMLAFGLLAVASLSAMGLVLLPDRPGRRRVKVDAR